MKKKIEGTGFFDTVHKKIKFKSQYGERLVKTKKKYRKNDKIIFFLKKIKIDIVWDKKDKNYTFVAPPASWLLGGSEPSPDLINDLKKDPAQVSLTLSGVEWINIGEFFYYGLF